MFEVWKEFRFDCAHALDEAPGSDGRYARLHGHSYQAEVWLKGARTHQGWVEDLGILERRLQEVAQMLDHRFLNEIEGLGTPTMENLAAYIWHCLRDMSSLYKVSVRRDSLGEGCTYFGPGH